MEGSSFPSSASSDRPNLSFPQKPPLFNFTAARAYESGLKSWSNKTTRVLTAARSMTSASHSW